MQKNKHKKWLGKGILLGIGLLVGGMTFGTGLMGSAQAASDSSILESVIILPSSHLPSFQ